MIKILKMLAPYLKSAALYIIPEVIRYISSKIVKAIRRKEKEELKND